MTETQTKRVYIADIKVKDNGMMYCTARNAETGELEISADLKYITQAAKERGWEILDAQDVLHKIGQNFKFYKGD